MVISSFTVHSLLRGSVWVSGMTCQIIIIRKKKMNRVKHWHWRCHSEDSCSLARVLIPAKFGHVFESNDKHYRKLHPRTVYWNGGRRNKGIFIKPSWMTWLLEAISVQTCRNKCHTGVKFLPWINQNEPVRQVRLQFHLESSLYTRPFPIEH